MSSRRYPAHSPDPVIPPRNPFHISPFEKRDQVFSSRSPAVGAILTGRSRRCRHRAAPGGIDRARAGRSSGRALPPPPCRRLPPGAGWPPRPADRCAAPARTRSVAIRPASSSNRTISSTAAWPPAARGSNPASADQASLTPDTSGSVPGRPAGPPPPHRGREATGAASPAACRARPGSRGGSVAAGPGSGTPVSFQQGRGDPQLPDHPKSGRLARHRVGIGGRHSQQDGKHRRGKPSGPALDQRAQTVARVGSGGGHPAIGPGESGERGRARRHHRWSRRG